jgi:hypothetical protein
MPLKYIAIELVKLQIILPLVKSISLLYNKNINTKINVITYPKNVQSTIEEIEKILLLFK